MSFDTRKATALLAYLALAERAHARDALAELLWPDHDTAHARGALRRTLSTLRQAVGDEHLETTRDRVALADAASLDLDVRRFRAADRTRRHTRAARAGRRRSAAATSSRASGCATARPSTTGSGCRPTACAAS